nr:NUDIX domain-containing protein [Pseudothauera nasutitermitis]
MITRSDGQALLVRKRGTRAFMQPGGKLEAGEQAADALCRELAEELGLAVEPAELAYLGRYVEAAANEPGYSVVAETFRLVTDAPVAADAEIEEVRWVDPRAADHLVLAPLTRNHFLALCR